MNLLPWRETERQQLKIKLIQYCWIGLIILGLIVGIVYFIINITRANIKHHIQNSASNHLYHSDGSAKLGNTANVLSKKNDNNLGENHFTNKINFQKKSYSDIKSKLKKHKNKPPRRPRILTFLPIHHAKAEEILQILKKSSEAILSDKGVIGLDPRTNSLWMMDTSKHTNIIKKIVETLDRPTPQVEIEARIVNMSRQCEYELGMRFGMTGGLFSSVPVTEKMQVDLGLVSGTTTPASIGFSLATLNNKTLLDLELSALESQGQAKIIASPRLLTVNRQPAVIKAGEEIPYQEFSGYGSTTAISFKQAVMRLKVTPQILPHGQLMLNLLINEDADSGQRVQGVPVILTKAIKTNVLIKNNQTIVLGGIYKQNHVKRKAGVPFLGDIPIVGKIFQRNLHQNRQEELLIFITPRIIAPIA